ncbi:MAG: carboxypeptidase-like regulatory domain-containing protein [Pirellulaceae bacterium]|nr:carboxypeptidase-like regulatory domain-containing protein [Pirellulaceae bacterium]
MPLRTRVYRGICLLVALSTALATQSTVFGAGLNAKTRSPRTEDVSLQAGGELRGQILDQQGRPKALTKVVLLQNQQAVGYAKTDITGRFIIPGLKPGAYQIQSEIGSKSVRLWAPRTAPPVAQQAVLLVADSNTARAQIDTRVYGPAIRGAIAGGLLTGLTYWAFDQNPAGS